MYKLAYKLTDERGLSFSQEIRNTPFERTYEAGREVVALKDTKGIFFFDSLEHLYDFVEINSQIASDWLKNYMIFEVEPLGETRMPTREDMAKDTVIVVKRDTYTIHWDHKDLPVGTLTAPVVKVIRLIPWPSIKKDAAEAGS
jgi:hypothetical protein